MKFEHSLYQKPLSMTGFGGGATSLSVAGAGGPVNPFDDMSNFSGATRVGSTDVIYYATSGTYQFTDPNAGLSRFRFTVVGGGGASEGDGGGWFSNTGAGGGGAARGEIQTSATLDIGVAQGGGSPAAMGYTASSSDSNWITNSRTGDNGINRIYGTGGLSYVKETSVGIPSGSPTYGNVLMVGRGGSIGLSYYAYYTNYSNLAYQNLTNYYSGSGFGYRYSGHGIWDNGGTGHINASGSGAGVNVTSGTVETGGMGGSGFHQSSGMPNSWKHPLDTNSQASNGENTTYAGGGGGGGASNANGTQQGMGGSASGLASLLSGSGITPKGGNGTYLTTKATAGVAGGGYGGNSDYGTATWQDVHYGGSGIVIVEFLGF
tara:strand:- start:4740 stop:5867 length:1128 start_codon:yes stop_codon:yes gene_type:complete